ncbi:hypothetical protein SEA_PHRAPPUCCINO_45 [Mycobacterium phage Phrappuccino]|uniref:Uncharacterized protein n=1 Tax=Mycobacterium phage Phrappuccino TaxID=2591223 RepID=A0A514DDN1_9CAUD|nr:hypothetical protein KHQ87_gp045 [Mycobacterium phage Phrappuccino]QDH91721.1 hypothetical protein SEA_PHRAPPUCCINO_45 [Mycobacterium phage Phrappuccino]QIQ63164.1 hypothetical protein SEA_SETTECANDELA_45 [Mycobacterium phage Settecandela]
MTVRLCFSCKELREIVYVDPVYRGHCSACVTGPTSQVGSVVRAMQFLSATVPFQVGDRVEARTGGELYDGVGTVTEVSFDLEHGGTPVYPTFHVVIDEPADEHAPADGWYTEVCLAKLSHLEPVG